MSEVKPSSRQASGTASAAETRASNATGVVVGFAGLGIMGKAMSTNLVDAGFRVVGFDPSEAARAALAAAGGQAHAALADVASGADVVICSLPHAQALMETARALAAVARTGQVVIETSTLDIEDKRAAREVLQAAGVVLLDCPLSGTGAQAARKDVSVYSSGPKEAVDKLQAVFDGFAKANYYLGEFGNGMRMKLMANLLVAIHNVSTAEVLLFGERMGISADLAVEVLADGAGGSRMLQVRGPVIARRSWAEAAMKVGIWQKDMRLIQAALEATHSPAPLFAATQPLYNAAMAAGHAADDTAVVYRILERMCGDGPADT